MVKLDKIYTRGGDKGQTSLANGVRIPKDHLRVQAFGDVDEVNAVIGIARLYTSKEMELILSDIQQDLFDLGADLSTPPSLKESQKPALRIQDSQVTRLEKIIDQFNQGLEPLRSFVLPGGTKTSAYLHLARTIARRAERHVVALMAVEEINRAALKYLNRLSDLLFVLGRYSNDKGLQDVLWIPGKNR